MTKLQSLLLRQSEIRERLNELLEIEARSDDQDAELRTLTTAGRGIEPEIRAAMVAEPEVTTTTTTADGEDAEGRELRELRAAFSVGQFLGWKAGKSELSGETREYLEATGVDGQLPVDVFEREERAVTPGIEGGTSQRPIVPAVFSRSIASFLGVSMPSAGTGDAAFPVLSTKPAGSVGPVAKDAAVDATAGAFTVSTQQPRRIGASFTIRYEDLARLSGMEPALRRALRDAITEELDSQLLNGSAAALNTDGEIRGLLAQLSNPSAPAAGAESWERFLTAMVSHLSDPWATTEGDVRVLAGEATYRRMASQFRASESNESFSTFWNRVGGGVRLSGKIASPSGNVQQAVIVRANPANDQAGVMPHWSAFDLTVRDHYTESSKGRVSVTIHALVGDVVILRPDVFVQDSFRVA